VPKWSLKEVDAETLAKMCDDFRAEIFRKAGKPDPANAEAGRLLPAAHGSAFDVWWHNEGSGMPPLPDEDAETHVRRICEIAWAKGAYKANEALENIIKQQPCCDEGGGCFYPVYDGEGNYIGEQHVDPLGVIQGMVQTAQDALTSR
jgi:hypothetical protein